jgi:hypothetical protein
LAKVRFILGIELLEFIHWQGNFCVAGIKIRKQNRKRIAENLTILNKKPSEEGSKSKK